MEFRSPGVVRVATGDDTAPGWTAAADGKVGIVKAHPVARKRINLRCLDHSMPVTAEIILGDVIGNEEDDIGPIISRECRLQADHGKCHQCRNAVTSKRVHE